MRKARLGFKIYSLDHELLVEEAKDFVWREEDRKFRSLRKERARKLRWYHNHKERYNEDRREAASLIKSRYKEAKRQAIKKGQEWLLNQADWEGIWMDAGFVSIPGTRTPHNPSGELRTAYSLRGAHMYNSTMMAREDNTGPWSTDNCYIVYRGVPLVGSMYHRADNPYIHSNGGGA